MASTTDGVPQAKPGEPAAPNVPDNLRPTWTLPDSGDALPLVAADFEAAAKQLGVEAAAIHAVADVESGGRTGFDAKKRPKILFETHHFRRETDGHFNTSHPELTAAFGTKEQRGSYAKDQWEVIRSAFALDPEAAVRSASWGMFQVLGSNAEAAGWPSLQQFVTDMFHSEAEHMLVFLGFCKANRLTRFLASKDWAGFARGYNGASYAENHYDTKMANAYARYSGHPVTEAAAPHAPHAPHARHHGKRQKKR